MNWTAVEEVVAVEFFATVLEEAARVVDATE